MPRRRTTLVGLFFGALIVVGFLECLHACLPRLASLTTDGRVAAFDLDGEGSLAVWFSTASLELAALLALLTWSVGHRSGGFRRPKVFLAAAACWLVMSIDECASVHEAFKELMSHSTGNRISGDGSLWWVICYSLTLSTVGTLLLLAFRRRAPEAAVALIAGGSFYVLAVVAELEWIIPGKGEFSVMLEEGCEMTGNLCVLLSMAFAARWASVASQQAESVLSASAPTAPPRLLHLRAGALPNSRAIRSGTITRDGKRQLAE